MKYEGPTGDARDMRGTSNANEGGRRVSRRFAVGLLAVLIAAIMVVSIPLPGARASTLPSAATPIAPLAVHASPWLTAPNALPVPTLRQSSVGLHPGVYALNSATLGQVSVVGSAGLPGLGLAKTAKVATQPPMAPHPMGSSLTNFQQDNSACSTGPTIAQSGSSNKTLVSTSQDWQSVFNGTGGSFCRLLSQSNVFYQNGGNPVLHSSDGGVTWKQTLVTANSSWVTTGSATNGSIHWEFPTVAASPVTNTVLFADMWLPSCTAFLIFGFAQACNATIGLNGSWGYDVARSANNGVTFSQTAVVKTIPQAIVWLSTTCTPSGYYYYDRPLATSLAYNGASGVAMVAWSMLHYRINQATCTLSVTTGIQVAVSTDDGKTWSTPTNISGPAENPVIVFGPASTHKWSVIGIDDMNGTNSPPALTLEQITSSNNGTTWAKPTDIGSVGEVDLLGPTASSPDAFFATVSQAAAADTNPTSAHVGNVYTVWNDNQTGTYAGYSRIDFLKGNGAGTFSTSPTYLTSATTSTKYFFPAVAVDPSGNVWVTYLGEDTSSGNYNEFGVFSQDGGATWSTQFLVSDQSSSPPSILGGIGTTTGITGSTNGVYPAWTDCRDLSCINSANLNTSIYVANVHAVNITSVAPGITAQVTTFGTTIPAALPAWFGWDVGATVSVSVPNSAPDVGNPSLVWSFQHWAGLSTSTNYVTSFSYSGVGNLTAVYVALPAGFIAGTLWPKITGTLVTLDNAPLTLQPGLNASSSLFNASVASGQLYFLNISAPNFYSPATQQLGAQPGVTKWFNWTFSRYLGYVNGSISTPPGAPPTLTFNNTTQVTVASNGGFSAHLPWGTYWYTASTSVAKATTNASGSVQVYPKGSTPLSVTLSGGWIDGTVTTIVPGLRVAVDRVAIPSSAITSGSFNWSLLGGTHHLTATAPGYNLTNDTLDVVAGTSNIVVMSLTNLGWVRGLIQPLAAAKGASMTAINLTKGAVQIPINTATGLFNTSITGGYTWHLQLSSTGYTANSTYVPVTPGNASPFLTFTMSLSTHPPPPNCTVTHNCTTSNTTPSGGSAFPTALVIGILAVVVLAAIIAVVLVMRRRPPAGTGPEGGAQEMPPESVYGEGNPSELPKLQSDGSFGGPPPPGPE